MHDLSGRMTMGGGVGVPDTALNEWARRKLADLGERKAEAEAEAAPAAVPVAASPKPKRTKGGKKPPKRKLRTPEQMAADRAAKIGVPAAQIERGGYVEHEVVDLSGELGDKKGIVKVLLNRGGTAVDRWIMADEKRPSDDRLFGLGEQNAIRYCQSLWTRADGHLAAVDPSRERVDGPLGWSQQEAITELHRLQARVPSKYWNVYENVCRFDQEAGAAGSAIATNGRSAIDAAKTTVAFTASLIATWRRL